MVLKLMKKNHPLVSSYGKYVAKVMHFNTITKDDIEEETKKGKPEMYQGIHISRVIK
jgi:hypothetical protein